MRAAPFVLALSSACGNHGKTPDELASELRLAHSVVAQTQLLKERREASAVTTAFTRGQAEHLTKAAQQQADQLRAMDTQQRDSLLRKAIAQDSVAIEILRALRK